MTLSKQLFLTVFITLIGLFGGMSYFTLGNTEQFVQNQLAQNAQDTANSLGLSLSTSLKGDDLPTAKRIIDALFDSGYYQNIKMVSTNGVVLIDLVNKEDAYDVPDWFEQLFNIDPPIKEAIVLDGWKQLGKVFVQCHPGFAYKQIYENMKEGLFWLIFMTLMVMTFGYFMLYILLKPLREIKKQAKLIRKKQFYLIKSIPWASDLKAVVDAMNHLSMRLNKIFEKHEKIAKNLQEKAYHDRVTGLKNKVWLSHKLYQLRKSNEQGQGLFIILELANFKNYNEQFGRLAGDQILTHTARLLETAVKTEFNPIVVRTEGACFIIVLLNKTADEIDLYVTKFSAFFKEYAQIAVITSSDIGHAGVTLFDYSETESEITKKANSALTQAKVQAANACVAYEVTQQENEAKLRTDTQWKKLFENALKENKFTCHFESITFFSETANHYLETLARLPLTDETVMPAREWIYVARRLQMIHVVDLIIYSQIVEKIKLEMNKNIFYFINLSSSTLLKPFYPDDMLARAKAVGQLKDNLIIEISEYDLIQHLEDLKPILEKLVQAGIKISIDQFGANINQLHYLYDVTVHYIKIDPSFTQNIQTHIENQMLVKTFIDIAHSVKAKAIAKNVESKDEAQALQKLGLDGVMGRSITQ
jgi:diguanylate cyclase (GGDEF)-like protein